MWICVGAAQYAVCESSCCPLDSESNSSSPESGLVGDEIVVVMNLSRVTWATGAGVWERCSVRAWASTRESIFVWMVAVFELSCLLWVSDASRSNYLYI